MIAYQLFNRVPSFNRIPGFEIILEKKEKRIAGISDNNVF